VDNVLGSDMEVSKGIAMAKLCCDITHRKAEYRVIRACQKYANVKEEIMRGNISWPRAKQMYVRLNSDLVHVIDTLMLSRSESFLKTFTCIVVIYDCLS
jgi:hypothetical protein